MSNSHVPSTLTVNADGISSIGAELHPTSARDSRLVARELGPVDASFQSVTNTHFSPVERMNYRIHDFEHQDIPRSVSSQLDWSKKLIFHIGSQSLHLYQDVWFYILLPAISNTSASSTAALGYNLVWQNYTAFVVIDNVTIRQGTSGSGNLCSYSGDTLMAVTRFAADSTSPHYQGMKNAAGEVCTLSDAQQKRLVACRLIMPWGGISPEGAPLSDLAPLPALTEPLQVEITLRAARNCVKAVAGTASSGMAAVLMPDTAFSAPVDAFLRVSGVSVDSAEYNYHVLRSHNGNKYDVPQFTFQTHEDVPVSFVDKIIATGPGYSPTALLTNYLTPTEFTLPSAAILISSRFRYDCEPLGLAIAADSSAIAAGNEYPTLQTNKLLSDSYQGWTGGFPAPDRSSYSPLYHWSLWDGSQRFTNEYTWFEWENMLAHGRFKLRYEQYLNLGVLPFSLRILAEQAGTGQLTPMQLGTPKIKTVFQVRPDYNTAVTNDPWTRMFGESVWEAGSVGTLTTSSKTIFDRRLDFVSLARTMYHWENGEIVKVYGRS